ncbi:MAG: hypothetical protein IJL14_08060 [Selenomonadaceae bacterium]|nr:hypothetical protein [Selenomonadaceae bacterium]
MTFDLQYFTEDAIENQTSAQLRKGIRSLRKKIDIHQYKIEHPWESYSDWFSEPKSQTGRIRHWQHEIEKFKESIQNRVDELKKRGENP